MRYEWSAWLSAIGGVSASVLVLQARQQGGEATVRLGGGVAVADDGSPAGIEIPFVDFELIGGLALEADAEGVQAMDGMNHPGRVIGQRSVAGENASAHLGFLLLLPRWWQSAPGHG